MALLTGLIGGLAKSYKMTARGRKPPKLWQVLANLIISGFLGLLTLFLAQKAVLGVQETCILCGMSGYCGTDLLEALAKPFIDKIKKLFGT